MQDNKLKEINNEVNNKIKELNYNEYSPKIIAVSKTFGMEKIKPLIDFGHQDFGENRVQEAFEKWSIQQSGAYVLKEAAILFESNTYQSLDAIICISCPEQIRLKRILKRDDLSEKQVRQRMSNQWAEEKKISLSDYVITNDNSCLVMPQILSVHNALK